MTSCKCSTLPHAHNGMYTQSMTGIAQQVYGLKQIENRNRLKTFSSICPASAAPS